jgi:2'-5' RNA ligase
MTRTKTCSLWLIPSENIYKSLTKLICQLSKKFSAPSFEPHITLIGKLVGSEEDIISKTSKLSDIIKPFRIRLTWVAYSDNFFRCLFIRAEETSDILEANIKAREIFDRLQDPKYTPHLSLLYGNFPTKMKEEIISEIGKEFKMNFYVRIIHLFSTSGKPKDWYKIKEFPIKQALTQFKDYTREIKKK